jgi:RecG-like helicase
MGFLQRLGARLTEPPERVFAQKVRAFCDQVEGVDQIGVCRPRTHVRVAGKVQSIKLVPNGSTSTLEMRVYDGTDEIVAVWFGRRKIPGVALGSGIVLEGTLTRTRGHAWQVINPAYQLVAEEAV